MAIGAVRSAWPTGSLFEQRDRTVPDFESAVPPAAETGDGVGGKPAQAADLDRPMRDYTTLCRCKKTLPVILGGLHLLVDSTGIKMMREGEWKTRKHGASYRRQWRKAHIGIDAETLDIRALGVITNAIGDAPVLPDLLDQIPRDEETSSVSGDDAYDTKKVPCWDCGTQCRCDHSSPHQWSTMERGWPRHGCPK